MAERQLLHGRGQRSTVAPRSLARAYSIQGNVVNQGTVQFDLQARSDNYIPGLNPNRDGCRSNLVRPIFFDSLPNDRYSGNMSGTRAQSKDHGGQPNRGSPEVPTATPAERRSMRAARSAYWRDGWPAGQFCQQRHSAVPAGNRFDRQWNLCRQHVRLGQRSGFGVEQRRFQERTSIPAERRVDADATLIGTTSSLQGSFDNRGVVQFMQSGTGKMCGEYVRCWSRGNRRRGKQSPFSGASTGYTGGTTVDAGSTLTGTSTKPAGRGIR